MRVWHDNSGKSNMASWYLKFIIVHDLQTKEKFVFICEKWLALEKDDGKVSRSLVVANQKQKSQFKYLISKETKQKLSDGHLWLSVFIRPTQSSFSRLDRLTCCFVLLYVTMLMNILYYEVSETNSQVEGIEFGPFKITAQQVSIIIFV